MADLQIHTFGCKVNTYDSGLLQTRMVDFSLAANERVHILNTCAVTQEATREAVRMIRRLKARDPFCTVVVTGCAAQVDTGHFDQLPGADLIVANSHKGQLEELLRRYLRGDLEGRVFKSNIFRKDDLEAGGGVEAQHTRAFLKIQDGCNSFCSFCIIPFARGKSRSIGVNDLVRRVNDLSATGVREVVLTGVHIGDYEDEGRKLEDLVEAICERTSIARVRLSSLEPIELSARLLELHQHPRMCAHFHMSVQSANSTVLSGMRRHYGHAEVEDALTRIQATLPHAFVGMDVIAGFSGESEDEFNDTYERLERLPWTRLHVFPYSERHGTKAAAREDQVLPAVRAARAKQLRQLSSQRYAERALQQIGTSQRVLVLRQSDSSVQGIARNFWPVVIESTSSLEQLRGEEIEVQIRGFDPLISRSRMDAPLLGFFQGAV